MRDAVTYRFDPLPACDMCGAPESAFIVLGRRLNRSQGPWPRRRTGIATTICRCAGCGLVFANPQPVPPSLGVHYDVPPEAYLNYQTMAAAEERFADEFAWLERLMPVHPGMRSLDIGAGIGLQMTAMARHGFDAYGLEPSEPFYRHAIEKTGIPADKLALASAETGAYPPDYFDVISFGAVLEHLRSPSANLARALEWLKPGGLMFAEVPSARWLISRMANVFYRATGTDYVANLSPMHAPFHLFEFTLEAFIRHGAAAGYVVADHRHFVCSTYLPGILGSVAARWMQATDTGMQLGVWLKKPHKPGASPR